MGNNANKAQCFLNYGGDVFYKDSASRGLECQVIRGDELITAHSYVYLYEVGNDDHFIASAHVPLHSMNASFIFDQSLIYEDASYYAVWSTCSCGGSTCKKYSRSPTVAVSSMRAYQRLLAQQAAEDERIKQEIRKKANDDLIALRRIRSLEVLPNTQYYYACTDEERAVLRKHFNQIDADGNGDVSWTELKGYYASSLGVDLMEFEVDEMMKEADFANRDSRIQFAEFLDVMVKCHKNDTSKKWKKVFDLFAVELDEASKRSRGEAFKRAKF